MAQVMCTGVHCQGDVSCSSTRTRYPMTNRSSTHAVPMILHSLHSLDNIGLLESETFYLLDRMLSSLVSTSLNHCSHFSDLRWKSLSCRRVYSVIDK